MSFLLEELEHTINVMALEIAFYKYGVLPLEVEDNTQKVIKPYEDILKRANNCKEELIKALVKELGSGRGREKRIRRVVDKFL